MCNILSLSATPGRLNDLLMNEIMDVRSVTYLVRLHHFLILIFITLSFLQCNNCDAVIHVAKGSWWGRSYVGHGIWTRNQEDSTWYQTWQADIDDQVHCSSYHWNNRSTVVTTCRLMLKLKVCYDINLSFLKHLVKYLMYM